MKLLYWKSVICFKWQTWMLWRWENNFL